ncbi:hypothetical protein IFM89_016775 [Coptis chinensis]|uniref:Agenet domain-containing protein n=1 Tax=Coptis chinensis TaxID=261450 RepID=A0A835H6X0_9MAGN|nr:hypothetical protein IFM89_016775 [Coptis chinensis]
MGSEEQFREGMLVEVCSDDSDLRGAWFIATVIKAFNKRNKKVQIQYHTLTVDEKGTKPLKEFVLMVNLRPLPPREKDYNFKMNDEVDAYYNDGWWEGFVTMEKEGDRFVVYFRGSKEEIEFGKSDLRLHREWVSADASWLPPLFGEEAPFTMLDVSTSSKLEIDQNKNLSKLEVNFDEGMHVEVSSDEDGFVGAWFTAIVVKAVGENKFLVEYQTLRTDDETELLKEEVDALHIRPPPPESPQVEGFNRLEEVDALYNEGWWVGVISKVLGDSRYIVYFRENNEEIEFEQAQLRVHQDWMNGKWIRTSEALML